MKKWINSILMSSLLLFAVPPMIGAAEELNANESTTIEGLDKNASTGTLTANGTNIDVSLTIPQAKTENIEDKITSLHFQLFVSIEDGNMNEPKFEFANTIKSEVKSAKAIKNEYSDYIIDIILSGKKDQSIFDSETAFIGTLSLQPTTDTYEISINFASKTASNNPFTEYVTSTGQATQTVFLENTKIVTIEKKDTSTTPDTPNVPSTPDTPSTPSTPGNSGNISSGGSPTVSVTPLVPEENTENTNNTGNQGTTNTGNNTENNTGNNTQTPSEPTQPQPDSNQTFDNTKKLTAEATSKAGKKRVIFQWEKVSGADGYIIYKLNAKTNKYKRMKTISNPEKTTCKKKMKYGTSYSFKVRAYTTAEDGSKTFGKYSAVIHVTTSPAKVKNLKVTSAGNKKISLSWKKVKNAKGYQIFSSKKKNGTYTLVKTLKKASANATIKQKNNQIYYKVRAFVKDADKNRVYGNFCTGKKA